MFLLLLSFFMLSGNAMNTSSANSGIINAGIINSNIGDIKVSYLNLVNTEKMDYWLYNLSTQNYLMRSFPYRGEAPPEDVLLAEFGGGVLGGAIGGLCGIGLSYYLFLKNANVGEWGFLQEIIKSTVLTVFCYSIGSAAGISYIGNSLGHRGSLLLSFLGTFLSVSTVIAVRLTSFDGSAIIIGALVGPVFGTIGYQFFSTYEK